ncbi:ankyrin repeat-containing domain protein [Xylaria scruposa]|nr:ankyrin repeat-containing domain protein [Xylaria scruposa]
MDNALNVSSTVVGALSLAIQIAQLTQTHTSRMIDLPRSVSLFVAELVSLKSLLLDIQDALFLPSTTSQPGVITHHTLPSELANIRSELENLHDKLKDAQSHRASLMLKNLIWPFHEDETVRWSNSLNHCKERIDREILVGGLRLQFQVLGEIRAFQDKIDSVEQDRHRRLVLDWICDDTWGQRHTELIRAHHPGTGDWIFDLPEFQDWASEKAQTLWCYGAPGAGKTQLMSLIIDRLSTTRRVCYFYCDYHSSNNRNVTTEIAAAILRQLVEAEKEIPEAVKRLYRTLHNGRTRLRLDDITSLICRITPGHGFIILDAVDECGPQRKPVLELLKKIATASISILISSRPHVSEISNVFVSSTQLEIKARPSDIRSFTEASITSSGVVLELIPEDAKEDIVRRIVDQSAGLFLITTLQCTHLTHLSRFSEIKKAVQTTPNELGELYKDSMERITLQPRGKRLTALRSLAWIFHSKRELSVHELVHALAIESNEAIPTYEDVVPRQVVLDVCAGLVIIDAKNDSFRFVHHTLYEYFKITHQIWFLKARLEITRACFAYLRLLSPEKGLTASTLEHPFLHYVAAHWGSHVRDEYDKDLDPLALAAFENHTRIEMISVLLEEEQGDVKAVRMCPGPNLIIQLSARLGALPILQLLSEHGHSFKGSDSIGRTALHWAARGGFIDVVQFLLREGVEADPKSSNETTPLHWAAKYGHARVVKELSVRTNPAEPTLDGRTALHWASSRGHISVVKILLSNGKSADVDYQTRSGWTALHWAACSGKRAVVVCGVEHGTQDTKTATPTAPLEALSMNGGESRGHEEVIRFLLKAGANPNLPNKENRTALHWAAASGNATIIRLLLENGADAETRDIDGMTPLHFAIENGMDAEVVQMLGLTV